MEYLFEDVLEIKNGKNQKAVENPEGQYPIYGSGGLMGYADDYICEADTVIIGRKGNINNPIYVSEPFWNVDTAFGLLTNKEILLPRYLFYFCKKYDFEKLNKTVTIPSLTKSDLLKIKIKLPNIEEQQCVIDKLNKIESIIELRKHELKLLDDFKKARFVEMFGDPVDNPMGWNKKRLQDIVSDDCSISYGIVQTGDDKEEGVPVFRPVDIVNRVPKLDELKKTTEEISNKYKRTILKGREMLITVRANIADTCIVGEEFKGCNVGRGIVPIRTKEDIIILEFLKYLMDSKHLNDDIKRKAKGITLIQLNMEDLREVELIIPPVEHQKIFVNFAKKINKSKLPTSPQKGGIAC
jgi:type I restriction enzyme S subunit